MSTYELNGDLKQFLEEKLSGNEIKIDDLADSISTLIVILQKKQSAKPRVNKKWIAIGGTYFAALLSLIWQHGYTYVAGAMPDLERLLQKFNLTD